MARRLTLIGAVISTIGLLAAIGLAQGGSGSTSLVDRLTALRRSAQEETGSVSRTTREAVRTKHGGDATCYAADVSAATAAAVISRAALAALPSRSAESAIAGRDESHGCCRTANVAESYHGQAAGTPFGTTEPATKRAGRNTTFNRCGCRCGCCRTHAKCHGRRERPPQQIDQDLRHC